MALAVHAFTLDARDPDRVARFWGELLGWPSVPDAYGARALEPTDDTGFRLRFVADDAPKLVNNRSYFDLVSDVGPTQREIVERALSLGATPLDVGQTEDEGHVVLADPGANEFCVLPEGNTFLAGCPIIGGLSSDGTQACGYFWAEALGWPLVWDQDEETAVQSPAGGTKIAWGGPPLEPKPAKNRVHLDLVPADGSTQAAEVDRLLGLGASRVDIGQGDVPWTVLADPDGNELCVWPGA